MNAVMKSRTSASVRCAPLIFEFRNAIFFSAKPNLKNKRTAGKY